VVVSPAVKEAKSLRHPTPGAMNSVLIVDDSADIRETLRMALEDEGYAVDEAADALTALDILRRTPEPVVVLLDHVMPGIDGIQALNLIGSEPGLAERHAYVMLTGQANLEAPRLPVRGRRVAVPLVAKPFDLDELLDVIKHAESGISPAS
jgi:CheY-like chemotaxis protein